MQIAHKVRNEPKSCRIIVFTYVPYIDSVLYHNHPPFRRCVLSDLKLKAEGINNIDIIANDGFYKNGGIELIKDREGSFYCEKFGIDKEKVVKHFRGKYETIAYAGDSFVDFDACKLCDFKFSRGRLDSILNLFAIDHYGFKNFSDIVNILKYKLK